MLTITCVCRNKFEVPDSLAGGAYPCPKCGQQLKIPHPPVQWYAGLLCVAVLMMAVGYLLFLTEAAFFFMGSTRSSDLIFIPAGLMMAGAGHGLLALRDIARNSWPRSA
jgi:hypothetical protein